MENKDFTFLSYTYFLKEAIKHAYVLTSYEDYLNNKDQYEKVIILRHDVDRTPGNSLIMARIEKDLNARASYYFRVVKDSFVPEIITDIRDMGHEIAHHYEELALNNGDYEKTINAFAENLENLRKFYPVKTMCMHGSPAIKWDNKLIWNKYNYRDYGIVADPSFDINFDEVFYITDASRSWNNKKVSRRDKVVSKFNIEINSVHQIAKLIKNNKLPNHVMINIHPHNWASTSGEWFNIMIKQKAKNLVKRILIILKGQD